MLFGRGLLCSISYGGGELFSEDIPVLVQAELEHFSRSSLTVYLSRSILCCESNSEHPEQAEINQIVASESQDKVIPCLLGHR